MWDRLAKALLNVILDDPELMRKIIAMVIDALDGDNED